MKRISIIVCAIVTISLCCGLFVSCAAEEKPAQPVILKFASQATGPYIEREQKLADSFNARCGPDYTIKYYPSEQMVSFMELLDACRTGAAEMVSLTPNAYSADEPKLGAIELPFLLNNIQAHIYAVPKLKPLYSEILEKQFNQKLLCLHNYTAVELISTKPIKKLEDMKGLLVHTISPVTSSVIEALGGAAVLRPFPEAYSLLEKKTVEAAITAPAAMNVFKLSDVAHYVTKTYMVAVLHGFSINLEAWNKLPKKIQDILSEEVQKTSDDIDNWLVTEWEADFAKLAAAKVEIYTVPQTEMDRWKAACQPYLDKQMATLGDFGKKVTDIANEANKKYPR
jgi:TRAP-type C4-dicarboxylate transport system substrate-binding protein